MIDDKRLTGGTVATQMCTRFTQTNLWQVSAEQQLGMQASSGMCACTSVPRDRLCSMAAPTHAAATAAALCGFVSHQSRRAGLPVNPNCPVLRPVFPCSAGWWQAPSTTTRRTKKTIFRHPPTIRPGRTSCLPPTARQCPLTLCLPSTWWARPCRMTATPFCWTARATAPPTQWSCCRS